MCKNGQIIVGISEIENKQVENIKKLKHEFLKKINKINKSLWTLISEKENIQITNLL